jgi:hypothetical protein
MKMLRYPACAVLLTLAVAGGCGDDKNTETTPATSTTLAAATPAAPQTTSATVVQNVNDGAVCSPQGTRGQTSGGAAMLCAMVGGRTIWRPA